VVKTAAGYIGLKEANNGDDIIIKKYNDIRPSGGYKMGLTDPWCAAFGSVVGYEAGCSSIIPIDCSCDNMIAKFKKNSLIWTIAAVILFLIVGFVSLTNSSQENSLTSIDKLSNEVSAEVDVEGKGIVIAVADKPGTELETNKDEILEGLILDFDIRNIVKQLRTAGAYAISVNDIRLTKYSRIAGGVMCINVDDKEIKPPYVIKALGNPDILENSLNEKLSSDCITFLEYRGVLTKFEKLNDLYILRQSEEERKFEEPIAENAKNVDTTKEPDETSPFKQYWFYGFYNFWGSPYVIYNNHKYEILVRDSIPGSRVGRELGSIKKYYSYVGLGEDFFGSEVEDGVIIASTINSEGYSDYLQKGAKLFKLKWNSTEKVIVVNDNGTYKRAVIVN
jgi:uncharacterized protein YlxW (UPF0749 family)